jgi:hypothetical protein
VTRTKLRRFRYDILVILLCWRTNGFESFELFVRKYRKHAMKDFGTRSEVIYLWKADSFWRGKAVPANHLGPPVGVREQCLRQSDYSFARYHNQTYEISFLQRNLIQTYYRERDREEFLSDCRRV